jgi:hypothetical protein
MPSPNDFTKPRNGRGAIRGGSNGVYALPINSNRNVTTFIFLASQFMGEKKKSTKANKKHKRTQHQEKNRERAKEKKTDEKERGFMLALITERKMK